MKLSQLTTDALVNVLCEITPYINNIVTDNKLAAELGRKIDAQKIKTRAGVMLEGTKKLNALVPMLLQKHRDDLYGILAALNGKTSEEIGAQNALVTAAQIMELANDRELLDFFKSWQQEEVSASSRLSAAAMPSSGQEPALMSSAL